MAEYRLIHGDCLAEMSNIESESIDCILTDPPYGIDYQSARRIDSRQWKPKIHNDKKPFVWFLPHAARVLRSNGCLLSFCHWNTAEAFRLAIGWAGLRVGAQLVWDRVGHGMGDPSSRPSPQHDLIWFATKTKGQYHFHDKRPSSVIRSQRLGGAQLSHPNEKPIDLLLRLVESYVPFGGSVFDPFLGSGTTGEASLRLGRSFIGIESDPIHFATATRRLASVVASLATTPIHCGDLVTTRFCQKCGLEVAKMATAMAASGTMVTATNTNFPGLTEPAASDWEEI